MAFNKKFFTGSFCCFDAKKRGYYDVSGFFRVTDGATSKTREMVAYGAPDITYSNAGAIATLTFNQKMMPDYTFLPAQIGRMVCAGKSYVYLDNQRHVNLYRNGVLDNVEDVESAKYYNVFIKNGKPLFSFAQNVDNAVYYGQFRVPSHTPKRTYKLNCNTDYVQISGSSLDEVSITTGYLESLYTLPDQNINDYEFDIILKVKTGSNLSGVHKLLKMGGFWFGVNDNKFAFSCPPSVVNGETVTSDKSYWIRVMQTGFDVLSYTLLYLEDNGTYTFDTLPGMGQWQIGAYGQFASCAAHNTTMYLSDALSPWGGSIDLLNCRAYIKYINTLEWLEVWRLVDIIN